MPIGHFNPVWAVGIALEAVATLAGCIGKQMLRYAAISKNNSFYLVGIVFVSIIDPIFDLSAYTFAAQSIIAPCAGMVIVWNVILAPIFLKEKLTRGRVVATSVVAVGTVCTGIFGSHEEIDYTLDDYLDLFWRPAAVYYYFCFCVFVVGTAATYRTGSPTIRACCMAGLGGALAGNSFATKAAVELSICLLPKHQTFIGCSPNPFLTSTAPYFFILTSVTIAVVAIFLLALSLRDQDALYMITVYEGCMVVTGAISGNVVLNEMSGQTTAQLLMYSLSILTILGGLLMLVQAEMDFVLLGTEEQRLMAQAGAQVAGAASSATASGRALMEDASKVASRVWEDAKVHGPVHLSAAVEQASSLGRATWEKISSAYTT